MLIITFSYVFGKDSTNSQQQVAHPDSLEVETVEKVQEPEAKRDTVEVSIVEKVPQQETHPVSMEGETVEKVQEPDGKSDSVEVSTLEKVQQPKSCIKIAKLIPHESLSEEHNNRTSNHVIEV